VIDKRSRTNDDDDDDDDDVQDDEQDDHDYIVDKVCVGNCDKPIHHKTQSRLITICYHKTHNIYCTAQLSIEKIEHIRYNAAYYSLT